jgi:16S rRNA (guanine527-N7)-methyltransferase
MSTPDQFASGLVNRTAGFVSLSREQLRALWEHYELLLRWNRRMSLTTVTELEEAVERHYAESLFLAARLPEGALRVWDVGSGAGFPGIPTAVVRPQSQVWLIESNRRKCAFLREACGRLPNVRVLPERAEGIRDSADWVISRAVRPLDVVEIAVRKANALALLVGEEDASSLSRQPGLTDVRLEELPWGRSRFLFLADVPRETSAG